MDVDLVVPVGVALLALGIFLLFLTIPGGSEVIGGLLGRDIGYVWRKSTIYFLRIVGTLLLLVGLIVIVQDFGETRAGKSITASTATPIVTPSYTPIPISTNSHTPIPSHTPTLLITPTSTQVIGKPPGDVRQFSISQVYDPSGYMGDIGDIQISNQGDLVRFRYETFGQGPHEWDWKYKNGVVNSEPAGFSGVMYLEPPNCWGDYPSCGYDLRGFNTVHWNARSVDGDVYVEFLIGGVAWKWNDSTMTKEKVPFPDSLPRISLGVYHLTAQSQSFQYDISGLPDDYFRRVVGGFGWVIAWGANDVTLNKERTGSIQTKTIIIEVSDITYEK